VSGIARRLSLDRKTVRKYLRQAPRAYARKPKSIVCVLFAYLFDTRWVPANLWPNLTLTQYLFIPRGVVAIPPLVTPLWSLPLEVEMYVALPVLFLLFRNRPIRLLAIVWGVAVAIACVQPRLGDRFTILEYVPCFLGGVMAWRVMRGADRRRISASLWPLAIAVISGIWMAAPEKHGVLYEATFGISLGAAMPLFREIQSDKIRSAAAVVARYSYGIYLCHFPIMVYVLSSPSASHPLFRFLPPMPRFRHFSRPIDLVVILALSVFLYL
jgi:peptidoglycan/LPS O-acetylase OafA/YrhL